MAQSAGAFFGFAIIIAAALVTWAIVALVDVAGDNDSSGDDGYASPREANNDIQAALNAARPGDTIYIPEGLYYISLTTAVDGTRDEPITLRAAPGLDPDRVVLKGEGEDSRILEILHSYYIIEGFTIDGEIEEGEEYRDQLIFAEGARDPFEVDGVQSSINGLVIQNMVLRRAARECVRLRYFVTNSVIRFNDIRECGVEDFQLGSSGENGEGVYIGTATNQWDERNGDDVVDVCRGNVVMENYIDTQGSEGIEVKEGSIENVIQYNQVYGQMAEESGIGIRGDSNIVRYNLVVGAVGACVRIGGNEVDGRQYGFNNEVYGNDLLECEYSIIKVNQSPQIICENDVEDPDDPDEDYERVRGDAAMDFTGISSDCPIGLSAVIIPPTPAPTDDDDFFVSEPEPDSEDDFPSVRSDDDDDGGDTSTIVVVDGGESYDYVGCYADSSEGRVLEIVAFVDSDSMSISGCVAACADKGEMYAGLQNGEECWCGSTIDYNQYGRGLCDFACTGDRSTSCGGNYSFSLFIIIYASDGGNDDQGDDDGRTDGDEEDADDDDVGSSDQGDDGGDNDNDNGGGSVAGGDYLGCFLDSDADPILDFAYEDEEKLTPSRCIESCRARGESLSGVQMGAQCFCGSSDDYTRYGPGTCDMDCTGDSSLTCGGRASSNVYVVD